MAVSVAFPPLGWHVVLPSVSRLLVGTPPGASHWVRGFRVRGVPPLRGDSVVADANGEGSLHASCLPGSTFMYVWVRGAWSVVVPEGLPKFRVREIHIRGDV